MNLKDLKWKVLIEIQKIGGPSVETLGIPSKTNVEGQGQNMRHLCLNGRDNIRRRKEK